MARDELKMCFLFGLGNVVKYGTIEAASLIVTRTTEPKGQETT